MSNETPQHPISGIENVNQEVHLIKNRGEITESDSEGFSKMSVSSSSSSTLTPDVLVEQFAKLQEQVREKINFVQEHLAGKANSTNNIGHLLLYLSNIANSVPLSRIGFYGRRGSGKTTLVNRLLGVDLLPTADHESIITLTEVYGCTQKNYLAITFYLSLEDWTTLFDGALDDLRWMRRENEQDLSPAIIQVLDQLTALWGKDHDFLKQNEDGVYAWEGQSPIDLIPLEIRPLIQTQYTTISETDFDHFKESLRAHIHRCKQIPMLVYKINIFGPFELLNQGAFSIVDIHGRKDDGLHYKGKQMCDRLFYMPNIDTLVSAETVKNCLNLENAFYSQFGVVLTHLDEIKHSFQCPTEEVITQFRTKIKEYLHHDEKEFFDKLTSIYCLENGEKKSEYTQFFEDFKSEVLLSRSLDVVTTRQVIHNYVNEVNLAFLTLGGKVDFQFNPFDPLAFFSLFGILT